MKNSIKILIAAVITLILLRNSQLQLGLLSAVFQHPFSTITACGICLLIVIFQSWRWYRLNAVQNIDLSFPRTIMPTYLGAGFNAVLPGSVGGDFVRLYFILKKYPAKKSAAVLSILVDRISSLLGIIVILCLTAPYYLQTYLHNDQLFHLLRMCLMIFIGGALTFLLLSKTLISFLAKTRIAKSAAPLLKAAEVYRNAKLTILESLIVTITTQLLMLTVIIIIGKMMGLPAVSALDYMMALAIGQLANLVPLTPGGIGIGEAAFANVIILLNPGTTAAYATVYLGLRLLSTATYFPGVLIGIFGFHLLQQEPLTPSLVESTTD